MTVETLDDLFSDDSMPQTAVDEELFELCTKFENASLTEAIAAARIAGLSDDELKNMLDALLMVQD